MSILNYLVISPVKDEARYIERTLRSMVQQTLKPALWLVVDDGSADPSADLVGQYAAEHDFIKLVRNKRGSVRKTGVAEVLAFNIGYELVRNWEFDCVVKLDGDLSFDADYFERLLKRFDENPRLGIASGIYLEPRGAEWKEIPMPSYHAAGASKVVRRECFEQIGGFIPERGWDTVDEIRAMAAGWHTTHFSDLRMKHWKPEGSGMGRLHTHYMHGEIYCRTRGTKMFLLLKVLHRMLSRPWVCGGLVMLWGYFHTIQKGCTPLVSESEARCYQALLKARVVNNVKRKLRAS